MGSRVIPSVIRKWSVTQLVNNFREGCSLVTTPVGEVGPKDVLIRNRFVGINASDINVPAGRYDPTAKPPFDIGFEGVAEVVQTGSGVSRVSPGQAVGHTVMGAFSEYQVIPEDYALPLPAVKSEYVPLLMSALGTTIGLDTIGEIKAGDNVLVTAAAGGAGQMAVQYAKVKGCNVVGTCSSDKKVEFLKSLGCDRVINYKKENVHKVLSKEYPNGLNVVFENVGGEMLVHAVNNIAFKGKIINFGIISAYEKSDMSMDVFPNIGVLILRCASMHGHLFASRLDLFPEYLNKLVDLKEAGKLQVFVDNGASSQGGEFRGLEDVPRAIEHLYSGNSFGKVVVEIPE